MRRRLALVESVCVVYTYLLRMTKHYIITMVVSSRNREEIMSHKRKNQIC